MAGTSVTQQRKIRAGLAKLPTLVSNPDRFNELRDLCDRLRGFGVTWQDIAVAAGTPTTTLVARLNKATGPGKPKLQRNSRAPAQAWREPTAAEVRRMRQLWQRVPRRANGSYDWQSEPAARFLAAASEVVGQGVPIIWISSQLHDMDGHSVGPSVLRNRISKAMGGSPHGRGLRYRVRNPAREREGRKQLAPDEARCPQHSRRITADELANLLQLHSQIQFGGYRLGMPEAEQKRRLARLIARDTEILRLWADRVSVLHMADVLGMSEGGVERARQHAKEVSGGAAVQRRPLERKPRARSTPPPVQLTDTESRLLAAAWERAAAVVGDSVVTLARLDGMRALNTLIDYHRGRGVTLTELAKVLGIERERLHRVHRTCRRYSSVRR